MNSKHEVKPGARLESRKTRAKTTPRSPPPQPVAERRKQPRSAAQPTYPDLLHFFNESADLLCIAGFDGKFKRLNPAWHAGLGWTLAELQARPFLDFVHPDDRPATLAEMDKFAAGAIATTFENRYHCKDGSWKWLQWTAGPLPSLQEIYAIARDVTEQKHLEKEILDTLDSERERVGMEMHDGLCQDLATIAALSAALVRKLPPAAAPESAAAREITELLRQSIQHAHDLARGFAPLHLKTTGLMAALADFCSKTGALFEVSCSLLCEFRPCKLDTNREVHVYRIVQEAVNNAIAHGRAKQIEVSLAFQNSEVMLAIRDDGVGIGDAPDGHRGIGLHTMAYRARMMGGSLALNRSTPRGTVVTCTFPLPPATPAT